MVSEKLIHALQNAWEINSWNMEKLLKQSVEDILKDDDWCEDFKKSVKHYAAITGDRIILKYRTVGES